MDAISCLAPPPALLSAASFADAAIARALHFSVMSSGDHSSSSASSSASATNSHHHHQYNNYSPLLCADHPQQLAASPYAPVLTASCDSVSVLAPDSPRRSSSRQLLGARAPSKKRRSRASKRAPVTYITTDPSHFRTMVQQVTGAQAEPASSLASLLAADPTGAFDASLLRLPATNNNNPLMATADHDHQQQEQQPCYPTLDSWNVVSMYERNDLL